MTAITARALLVLSYQLLFRFVLQVQAQKLRVLLGGRMRMQHVHRLDIFGGLRGRNLSI